MTSAQSSSASIVLRCGDRNHLSFNYRNGVVCFYCKKLGHRVVSCPILHPRRREPTLSNPSPAPAAPVQMEGYLEIPFDDGVAEEVWNLRNHAVAFLSREWASPAEVSHRVKEMWGRDWGWGVKRLNVDSFMVAFSSSSTLAATVGEPLSFDLGPFSLKFHFWSPEFEIVERRSRVRLRVFSLPMHRSGKGLVDKALYPFGELLNLSHRAEFIEVTILCDNPNAIPSESRLLLGNFFYILQFEILETSIGPASSGPSSPRDDDAPPQRPPAGDCSPWEDRLPRVRVLEVGGGGGWVGDEVNQGGDEDGGEVVLQAQAEREGVCSVLV